MKDIVIVDLDGTLACGQHRLHLLPSVENRHLTECWDEFNLACAGDAPIEDTIAIVNSLYAQGYHIVILTGRCDVAKEFTVEWLQLHDVCYDQLIMRKAGDHRQDIVLKEAVLREIGLDKIICAFDDLPHVVSHIRSLGITCYHVCDVYADYAERNKGAGTK